MQRVSSVRELNGKGAELLKDALVGCEVDHDPGAGVPFGVHHRSGLVGGMRITVGVGVVSCG